MKGIDSDDTLSPPAGAIFMANLRPASGGGGLEFDPHAIGAATEATVAHDCGPDCLDRMIAYVDANTDQEELAGGRLIASFDWDGVDTVEPMPPWGPFWVMVALAIALLAARVLIG